MEQKNYSQICYDINILPEDVEKLNKLDIIKLKCLKENLYNDEKPDKLMCLYEAVKTLESFFLKNKLASNEDLENNTSWVIELLTSQLRSDLKTADGRLTLGAFAESLVKLGSSRNQAKIAIAEWLGISEGTVRNGYEFFNKQIKSIGIDDIILLKYGEFIALIKKANKPFPKDHPKAEKAFLEFKTKVMTQVKIEDQFHNAGQ